MVQRINQSLLKAGHLSEAALKVLRLTGNRRGRGSTPGPRHLVSRCDVVFFAHLESVTVDVKRVIMDLSEQT